MKIPVHPSTTTHVTAPSLGTLPLVGRDEELAFLVAAIRDQGGAILGGAAGVGKTRLVREIAMRFPEWSVSSATVTPAAADLALGGLAGLALWDGEPASDRAALLSRSTKRLLARAQGRPVLVVVDDAHLLDGLSSTFLHQLVGSHAARVVVTVRSGEPAPPAIVSLSKDRLLPRLELQPLGAVEFGPLVTTALGGPPTPDTLGRLWASTAGNVLFLRELLADALESGALRFSDGSWTWDPGRAVGPRLAELVADRMGRLEGPRRLLVELLAVGEPLGPDPIERLAPGADLGDEERRGLVIVEEQERRLLVRLAHPLFGEVTRARLPVVERRRLQRRLADAVAATGARRRDDLLRIALWRVESATATDTTLLNEAARQARQAFDPALATRLAEASRRVAPSFEAGLVLGSSLAAQGRFGEARMVLDGLAGAEPDARARHLLARERSWAAFWESGDLSGPRSVLERAEAEDDDPVAWSLARSDLALLLVYAGRFTEALEIGRPLVASGVDDRVRLRAFPAVGACLVLAGRSNEVLALCDELEAAAVRCEADVPEGIGWLWQMRTNALLLAGRLPEALRVLRPPLELGARPTLGAGDLAYARTKLGLVRLLEGRPATALHRLEEAAAVLRRVDPNGCLAWCLSLASQAHAQLGDVGAARRLVNEASKEDVRRFAVWEGDAARARAWVAAQSGEATRAIDDLVAAADLQERRGQPAFGVLALHDALRLGARHLAGRLEALASGLDGPLPAAMALHARSILADGPAGLEASMRAFATLGCHSIAAELAERTAIAWRGSGFPARAERVGRVRDEEWAMCETAERTVSRVLDQAGLTRREAEIAALTAQGHSNAEIAERLVVSVRTVESHLYKAYEKLDVTNRQELSALLGPGTGQHASR